ncbi:hypothetical protein [Halapricum hydrolyticum]|uniref:Uncharacterized protein n=1 Tax=Halapricum hydrolyticum TaxID=2979991 RepID=A0AAE3LEU0_9EURY|nr:hypothetical protein [Halapricum hydrolyticum]MCU4718392.1 hypothetical protein [Halapricum hydrolyticum]MCU4726495.1 hypothetical protein [Halapricum hydrolyticum]
MDRRSFLLSGATVLGTTIAGCNSDGPSQNEYKTVQQRLSAAQSQLTEVENELSQAKGSLADARSELNASEDDLAAARQTITEYEEQVGDLESELTAVQSALNSKNQTIQDLESVLESRNQSVQNLEESLTTQKTTTEDQKKRLVIWFYGYGITLQNAAVSSYNNGYDNFVNEDYILAAESFATAFGQYDGSAVLFNNAYDRASEFGYTDILSYFSDAERAMDLMASANRQYEIAARLLAQGESADQYISDGDEYYNESQNYTVVRRSVIEDELGVSISTE